VRDCRATEPHRRGDLNYRTYAVACSAGCLEGRVPSGCPPRSFLFGRCRPRMWPTPAKKGSFRGRWNRPGYPLGDPHRASPV